jgi:deoxyribodipyrimidine photo-lyase
MQFLLESIAALSSAIEQRGSRLFLVQGKSVEVVPHLARRWRIDKVVAQRWTEPFGRLRDERIARALDTPFELFDGETLAAPGAIRNREGQPYSVYSAFARTHRTTIDVGTPLRAPGALPPPPSDIHCRVAALPTLHQLGLARNPNLPRGGERPAKSRLARFLRRHAARYDTQRDDLDLDATSRLSVDLHFGTLSPRAVWVAAERALLRSHPRAWRRFSDELLWREFAHALLWDHPYLLEAPRRAEFASLPWARDEAGWRAWCAGKTGYPVVDAAARQLLAEGFVPNRARMIAASFLTKDLRIDYRRGEAHYLKYLVDGDWAQNNFNWQWVAGCGFDSAPYFRVFNPVEQGKRFDPTGRYVRLWVPELSRVPNAWIHEPWRASEAVLRDAGVKLGSTYPHPIVDHREARARYLSMMGQPGLAG